MKTISDLKNFKWIINACLILGFLLVILVVNYALLIKDYKQMKNLHGYSNWTRSMPPLHTSEEKINFIIDDTSDYAIKIWWKGLSGTTAVTLVRDNDEVIYKHSSKSHGQILDTGLEPGKYEMTVKQDKFTGAIAIGFDGITLATHLNPKDYTLIHGTPAKGFNFDYILYVPAEIRHNTLLVVPNNTGFPTDNYDIHTEKAKSLAKYRTRLANELGVPMLIPIFPRPSSQPEMYTHALDRNTMIESVGEINRLDLQLIAMIKDVQNLLTDKQFEIDDQVIMAGFSASGNFVDRFSYLHPDMTLAISAGASDNVLPIEVYKGINLPYPVGLFDYKNISNKSYNRLALQGVHRFYYKGAQDQGGWMTTDIDGQTAKLTWEEYYQKYLATDLEKHVDAFLKDQDTRGSWSNQDIEVINYLAYDGELVINRFNIASEIYSENGFDNCQFKIYENVGHDITETMFEDELHYFKGILESHDF